MSGMPSPAKLEGRLREALTSILEPGEELQAWTIAAISRNMGTAFTLGGAAGLAGQIWTYVALTNRRVIFVHANSFWKPQEEWVADPADAVHLEVGESAMFTKAVYRRDDGTEVPLQVQKKWRKQLEEIATALR